MLYHDKFAGMHLQLLCVYATHFAQLRSNTDIIFITVTKYYSTRLSLAEG